jgi:hypothetical protein
LRSTLYMCVKIEQLELPQLFQEGGEREWERMIEEANLIKTHYKYICKCHNSPVQLIYTHKIFAI